MTKETLAYENIDREFKELYVSDIKKTVVAFANTDMYPVFWTPLKI